MEPDTPLFYLPRRKFVSKVTRTEPFHMHARETSSTSKHGGSCRPRVLFGHSACIQGANVALSDHHTPDCQFNSFDVYQRCFEFGPKQPKALLRSADEKYMRRKCSPVPNKVTSKTLKHCSGRIVHVNQDFDPLITHQMHIAIRHLLIQLLDGLPS